MKELFCPTLHNGINLFTSKTKISKTINVKQNYGSNTHSIVLYNNDCSSLRQNSI